MSVSAAEIAMGMQRETRNQALEDAATAVERARLPGGDAPITLLEVKTEIAKAIRRMKR